jgi:hypothetical protein
MTVYTVHEPPPRKNESAAAPERFLFVRDGFYFWAFLLGPVWMLWHRLWLVLTGYVVAMVGIETALWALGASSLMKGTVGFLVAVLIGCEAGTLRRWSLRRWNNAGLVVAPTIEEAERRFFGSWQRPIAPAPQPPAAPPAPMRVPTFEHDVIGLFPEPQPRP